MKTRKVNFVIEVPDNIFCYSKIEKTCCQYFSRDGDWNCSMGFRNLEDTVDGVLKPIECKNLKWVKKEI